MVSVTPYIIYSFTPDGLIQEIHLVDQSAFRTSIANKITEGYELVAKIRVSASSSFAIMYLDKSLIKYTC